MKAFLFTAVAILAGFAASVLNIYWLAALATTVALVAAYAQFRDTVPYELVFSVADWQNSGPDFQIAITRRKHRKARPSATIYLGTAPHYELAMCDIHTSVDDTVVLIVSEPVTGKVVIR